MHKALPVVCASPDCAAVTGHVSRLCAACRERRDAQFAAEDALGDALGDAMARQGRSTTACDDQWAPDPSGREAAIEAMVQVVQPHEWRQGGAMRYAGHTITWGEYVQRRKELMDEPRMQAQDDLADAWDAGEERMDAIGTNGNDGLAYPDPQLPKQVRYRDSEGEDWIDEFARTSTPEEFRGAMRFTVGKYIRRVGRKDEELSEVRKMRDYCQRWEDYLVRLEGEPCR